MKPLSIFSVATPSVIARSAIYLACQVLTTLVICPFMLLLKPAGFSARNAFAQIWVRCNLWVLRTVCGLSFELKGRENIPAQAGVIFCKHQSAWETIAVQTIFPAVAFILKQELLRIPVWGWAMASLEPVAIDRQAKTQAIKHVLRDGEDRIRKGRWIVIFPEGTRMLPGQRGNYASSGGLLAQRAGCPLLPVAHNAGEFWTKNGFLKFPGVIQVRIGRPIDAATLGAGPACKQAEEWIEAQMAEITGIGPYARAALSSQAP